MRISHTKKEGKKISLEERENRNKVEERKIYLKLRGKRKKIKA